MDEHLAHLLHRRRRSRRRPDVASLRTSQHGQSRHEGGGNSLKIARPQITRANDPIQRATLGGINEPNRTDDRTIINRRAVQFE